MKNEKHILIITEDENSKIFRSFVRCQIVPIARHSIVSAIYILRHTRVDAIVIDKELHDVDTLEFVLNVRDITLEIPIYIPDRISKNNDWESIENEMKISIYDDENKLIETINKIVQ